MIANDKFHKNARDPCNTVTPLVTTNLLENITTLTLQASDGSYFDINMRREEAMELAARLLASAKPK